MKILVLVDPETTFDEDPHFEGLTLEIRQSMEYHVITALRELGFDTSYKVFGPNPLQTVREIKDEKIDLVFNLTEHFEGDRHQDAHITGLLDLMNIPYTGSGTEGLILCRDKATSKRLLSYHHIRLPHFFVVRENSKKRPNRINYPIVVKPAQEDGSDGISLASIVNTETELNARIKMIHERMSQPAICEEYIEGRELYVGITGNEKLTAYPAREVRFSKSDTGGPVIATARVKTDEVYRRKWGISYENAGLDPAQEAAVARVSKRIYHILRIQDYGRIDLRVTPKGEIVFLEANPNPNLCEGDDLAEAAELTGMDHNTLVEEIVNLALQRYTH